MNQEEFIQECEDLCEELYDLVKDYLPDNGDKCSESQRMCILQAISEVEHNINGLTDDDFIEHEN